MIRPSDKKAIIAVLGAKYGPKIVEYLSKNKIYNANGDEYSYSSISMIVNGNRENERVELAIAKFVAAEKKRKKELQKTQVRLFK